MVQPVEQETPHHDHAENGADGERRGLEVHGRPLGAPGREERHERDERDGGEILEQQNREGDPAVARIDLAILFQQLQRKRGRGQRQSKPDEHGLARGEAERQADGGQRNGGGDELDRAEPEDRRAHGPQPHRAQLEPDHEQQHHDAELGEMEDVLDVVDRIDEADAERADHDAGREIAEHRAEAQEAAERRGNGGGGQKHRHLNEFRRHHACACPARLSLPWRGWGR